MILLIIFAFVAGAATALSPCALPVLPVVLSAGTTGGRRRPLGLATGLATSFTFATVALVYVISALGLPDDLLRTFAIAVLLVFGLSLLVPKLSWRIEAWISRMTSRGAGRVTAAVTDSQDPATPGRGRDGFRSGFLIGAGLGFVYAPCAGPILASVITVSASQDFSSARLAVALAYGLGSAITFYALMLGGRRLIAPLVKRSAGVQAAMGIVMVFVAVAMFANLDLRFQTAIASKLPAVLVNPTGEIEQSKSVKNDLAGVSGRQARVARGSAELRDGSALPDLGPAPDFVGNQRWFNTADGKPLTIAQLRGKVVLVDFWTYTCINCIRTFPHLRDLYKKYKSEGLVIVGVHTPEFPFEKSADNVRQALELNDLEYPVAQDNDYKTWDVYGNQFWPAKYLIDAEGNIRYTHFGEGDYDITEQAVRSLIEESGNSELGEIEETSAGETASTVDLTPETYLGSARATNFINGPISPGAQNFGPAAKLESHLKRDQLAFSGNWDITADGATAGKNARLALRFRARRVFLVMGTSSGTRSVRVLLDGKPVSPLDAGQDVKSGRARISEQRLYRLIELDDAAVHTLTLLPARGITGYAFTFG